MQIENWVLTVKKAGRTAFHNLSAMHDDSANGLLITKNIIVANGRVISDINVGYSAMASVVPSLVGVCYDHYAYKIFDTSGNEIVKKTEEPTVEDIFLLTLEHGHIYPTGRDMDFSGIELNGERFIYETWSQK